MLWNKKLLEGDHVRDIVPGIMDIVQQKSPCVEGIPVGAGDTGFAVHRGEFTSVLARSLTGSTSMLLTMAVHAAVRHDIPCAYFSIDLSKETLVQRMLCLYAGQKFPLSPMDTDYPALTAAAGALSEGAVYMHDGHYDLELVDKTIRNLVQVKKVQLIFIDTIDDVGRHDHPEARVLKGVRERVCARLRMLASSLNAAIIGVIRTTQMLDHMHVNQDLNQALLTGIQKEAGDIYRFSDNVALFYTGDSPEIRELYFIKQKRTVAYNRSRLVLDTRSLRCSFIGEDWP